MREHRFHILGLLIACLFSLAAHAQMGGNLKGVVTDSSKAVVPGATLTILNTETGNSREAKTNAQGYFEFNVLPPALYDLSVAMDGFNTGSDLSERSNLDSRFRAAASLAQNWNSIRATSRTIRR